MLWLYFIDIASPFSLRLLLFVSRVGYRVLVFEQLSFFYIHLLKVVTMLILVCFLVWLFACFLSLVLLCWFLI